MISIYYNNTRLNLINNIEKKDDFTFFNPDSNSISKIIDQFLNENTHEITIVFDDLEEGFNKIKHLFIFIVAAGGVVYNSKEEILLIYRHQKWDLPKGKLEKGEDVRECAVREVEEETGVKVKELKNHLCNSYHIYPYKNSYALKETYWYRMISEDKYVLEPQLEEDITALEFVGREEAKVRLKASYKPFNELMDQM